MTTSPDKLLSIARNCGATEAWRVDIWHGVTMSPSQLADFAEIVRQEERERCAKVCDERGRAYREFKAPGWHEVDHESAQCAYAIRSISTTESKCDA